MLRRLVLISGIATVLLGGRARAQDVTISVRVVDSINAPVIDADVSIVRDVATALAHATTNRAGRAQLRVARNGGTLQLIVRKIGFQPGYRFFTLTPADTLSLDMLLARSIVTLGAVTVNAREDAKRKSYHLEAEEIETTTRAMIDATDILKLRPDMITSRAGVDQCGLVRNIWVNGQRIIYPVVDSATIAGRMQTLGQGGIKPPRPNPRLGQPVQRRAPAKPAMGYQPSDFESVLAVLASIKPEHIAEVNFQDCFDDKLEKNHTDMAIFVVLKPGIGYKDGSGSYVVADAADAKPHAAVVANESAEPPANASDINGLPRYRFRLLGVYDASSGEPLAGVDVVDTLTRTSARTTATGTVSLFFIPEGIRGLLLHRDGYRDTTITVSISPTDTLPVTQILAPVKP